MSDEKKKMDPAIMVAIISGAVTLVAALISSPFLVEYLKSRNATATVPVATTAPGATEIPDVTATPPGSAPSQTVLSFEQDFESNTSGFAFIRGEWRQAKDKNNGILEGSAAGLQSEEVASAVFGPSDFTDGLIEFQVNFRNADFGGLYLNARDNFVETYILYLSPLDQDLVLGFNGEVVNWQLQPFSDQSMRPLSLSTDTWYTVQLELLGTSMTVWVDENRFFTANDERLAQGRILFAIDAGGTVMLDNVKVWEFVK